jgi:TRAP-type mannitol/chloroaromatic compound transport system permease small subunit
MLIKIERFFDKTIDIVGKILIVILLLMILNVFFDVVMRYAFHHSIIAMEEMEWHLFSIVILYGTSYALKESAHVRVDFLYDRFSIKTKALINIFGTLIFLMPFIVLIIYGSYQFVMDSYEVNEISNDPGGLKYLWVIKSMIPISFMVLFFGGIGCIIKNINVYRGLEEMPKDDPQGVLS